MGVLLHIFVALMKFFNFILQPFLYISKTKGKQVPPPTDQLLMISATKLAKLIRQKKVTSERVITSYITRIREVNPLINAVVEERFEKALEDARSVDRYLKNTDLTEVELQNHKPLLGIPFTVKSSCKLVGMDYSVGVGMRKDLKADADGYAVRKLKSSGAIPLLVSNTPEGCMSWYCHNKISGRTCNPYDITRTSGGSSGGEGALLGAGASLIGVGSDLAGSVRIPAVWCGVYGHKPTPHMIPLEGHFPYPTGKTVDYFTIGPMTRYAEDLKLVMSIMGSTSIQNLKLHKTVDLSMLRIYYMSELAKKYIHSGVENEIRKAIEKAANFLLKNCNSRLMSNKNFESDFSNSFVNTVYLLFQQESIANSLKMKKQSVLIEVIKAIFGISKFTFCFLFMAALQILSNHFYREEYNDINERLKINLLKELGNDGVLILPTYSCVAPRHREAFFKCFGISYLALFNTIGFPVTQVPCGRGSDGLPIGLQVVAGPNQDRLCFAVAEELEKYFGGWIPTKPLKN